MPRSESKIARFVRAVVATVGAWFIHFLIWVFGRKYRDEDIQWLLGPVGGDHIGDRPYDETAQTEGLTIERNAERGGLIPDFDALAGPEFEPTDASQPIREFYENTAAYRLDTWATTYFPARLALWLLVTTISRRVDQLNFPLESLDMAHGMTSEIVLLRKPDGSIKYTGWLRKLRKTGRTIYTGFYMTEQIPAWPSRCVKVVFPMPNGNATVILRPENGPDGEFRLDTSGKGFGDVGFYRVTRLSNGRHRVWRIRTLREKFRFYVDEDGAPRCEHDISFLGLRVLSLHYRVTPVAADALAG